MKMDFAVIIPMANEEKEFHDFVKVLVKELDALEGGVVYFIVDNVSRDKTLELCNQLSSSDKRFFTIWEPNNNNVVDAYMAGYRRAAKDKHKFIIEMDAGLSHDPAALPLFLQSLNSGNECVFGSRFIKGGAIYDSNWKRTFLSKTGTSLSNFLLGTKLHDATSGFQGFNSEIVEKFLKYKLLSEAHFYQTELRYLLRKTKYIEIPITYKAPSPSISSKSITNSVRVLLHYFFLRLRFKAPILK